MKRLFIICGTIAFVFLSACSKKPVAGEEIVEKAKNKCEQLNSATITVTNTETGKVEQTFSYLYDDDDNMVYLYKGIVDGKEVIEYNDSKSMYIKKDGNLTTVSSDNRDFEKFTIRKPHPNAGKGMILMSRDEVTDATVTLTENGKIVHHEYDTDKIEQIDKSSGKLTKFIVEYYFDKNDDLLYFTEKTVFSKDGKETANVYKMEISEKNSIISIEKPAELQ